MVAYAACRVLGVIVIAASHQSAIASLSIITAPPPVPTKGVVRLGDTLFKIAQRYGISMQDILRFNPGLDTANLVAGTEIHLEQSYLPQPQLARPAQPIKPKPLRFDKSLDELVRQGVVSPAERQRIRTGPTVPSSSGELAAIGVGEGRGALPLPPRLTAPSQKQNSTTPIAKPLSERETALLQQIRSDSSPVWRLYGKCKYDWSNWKKLGGDIRFTSADCGPSRQWTIGVSCMRLMTNIYSERLGWQGWTKPAPPNHESRAGEDEMVAALCANLQSSQGLDIYLPT